MATTTTLSMKSAVPTLNITAEQLSALKNINETVDEWAVGNLPCDIRIFNGTIIEGSVPNTTNITRISGDSIGNVSLIPFIYSIMSIIIVLAMIPESVGWVRSISGKPHRWERHVRAPTLTPRKFENRLLQFYPTSDQSMQTLSQAEMIQRNQGTESQDIRECQELIRAKFGLDVEVYTLRHAKTADMHKVEDKMRRIEGALEDLKKITEGWRNSRNQWSDDEYQLVLEIQERVQRLPV